MITSADIKQLATRAGFDLCGICSAEPIPSAQARFMAWLDKGYHADMNWMAGERNVERRTNPSRLGLDDAKSVIMLALNYYQPDSDSVPDGHGQISKYARGRDYHKVAEARIKKLLKLITTRFPETADPAQTEFKWWVDYGPFMERAYAAKAGLGFLGKNGMLISRPFGSWLFLAEIVTSLELEPDDPNAVSHGRCGKCTRCIDACPTDAIVSDGVVDSSLCLSYWTIEDPLNTPESIAAENRLRLFGCDICQDVCPHNNKHRSILTSHDKLTADHGVGEFVSIDRILSMTTRDEFLELTAGTALTRPKLEGLQHTARIMQENQETEAPTLICGEERHDCHIHEMPRERFNMLTMSPYSAFVVLGKKRESTTNDKFAMELFSTWLLAVFLIKCKKHIVGVGFPCVKGRFGDEARMNLDSLKRLSVECSEVDTLLLESIDDKLRFSKIQVVRYKYQPSEGIDDLFKFLRAKKLRKYQPDESVHLLVYIEDAVRFGYLQLAEKLSHTSVPFGTVVAIGHVGPPQSLKYFAVRVHPSVEGPIPIDFRKPPPG